MRFIRCVRERTKKRTTENPCAARLLSIYLYFSTIVRYKYSPNMRVSFFWVSVCVLCMCIRGVVVGAVLRTKSRNPLI